MTASALVQATWDDSRLGAEPLKCVPSLLPHSEMRLYDRYRAGQMHLGVLFGDEAKSGFTIRATPSNGPEVCHFWLDAEQTSVLSLNIQIVHLPDGRIPSSIRLERFENLTIPDRDGFYEFIPLIITGQEASLVASDRKINIAKLSYAVPTSDYASEHVKRTSNHIDISSELKSDQHVEGGVVFEILDSYVKVSIDPILHPFVEGWKLGLGPIYRG